MNTNTKKIEINKLGLLEIQELTKQKLILPMGDVNHEFSISYGGMLKLQKFQDKEVKDYNKKIMSIMKDFGINVKDFTTYDASQLEKKVLEDLSEEQVHEFVARQDELTFNSEAHTFLTNNVLKIDWDKIIEYSDVEEKNLIVDGLSRLLLRDLMQIVSDLTPSNQ